MSQSISDEVDAIVADYPSTSLSDLAASFERTMGSYDGEPEQDAAILAELKRRASST